MMFILQDCDQDVSVRKTRRTGRKGGDTDTNLNFPVGTSVDTILELTLRDMILEVEEKLYVGVLGRLQVPDREKWRTGLTKQGDTIDYDLDKLDWAGRTRIANFKVLEDTGPGESFFCWIDVVVAFLLNMIVLVLAA